MKHLIKIIGFISMLIIISSCGYEKMTKNSYPEKSLSLQNNISKD